ncbi:FMN reductase (NADPH) [Paramyrothecium foliicola]|nr:FMN reductase (NADPH) [Paramyrothecium foliicola]
MVAWRYSSLQHKAQRPRKTCRHGALLLWKAPSGKIKQRRSVVIKTLSGKRPYFWYLASISIVSRVSQQQRLPGAALDYIESFILSVIETSLAEQNAVIAAESFGLATCGVGGAPNNPPALAELLHLPPRVMAIFGLAGRRPDSSIPVSVNPRLCQREVLHRETWDEAGQDSRITAYDKALADFNSSEGRETMTWTERAANRVVMKEALHELHVWNDVLNEQNFKIL